MIDNNIATQQRHIYSVASKLAKNDVYNNNGFLITHDVWEDSLIIMYNNQVCFESNMGLVKIDKPGDWKNELEKLHAQTS